MIKKINTKINYKNLTTLIKFLSSILLLVPITAFAFGGDTPVSQGLSYVTSAMYGSTGIALATIAIIAIGVCCYFHVLEWKRFIQTIAGIAIVFGAPAIVSGVISLVSQ